MSVPCESAPASVEDLLDGRPLMKDENQVADPHLVVFLELLAAGDPLLVDECTVAAVEVFDVVSAFDVQESSVLAADGSHLEHDIAVGISAQYGRILLEQKKLPGIEPP